MPRLFLLLLAMLSNAVMSPPAVADDPDVALHEVPGRPQAPDFSLRDSDGAEHRLSDYRGRVVIVNFWATWCPPCREEMPSMQRAWPAFQEKDIAMLAINVGEDADTVFEFTAYYPVEFPLLLDEDSAVIKAWPVRGLPTTFVVDPQGRIVFRAIGARKWDDPALLETIGALRKRPD
jgi:peroxiredoxin